MTERSDLLATIAGTIRDYRAGEIAEPTPGQVDRWVGQFDRAVQVPMLRELAYVFKRTYYAKSRIVHILRTLAHHPPNRSTQSPCAFWQRAQLLDVQQDGGSQSEIRNLFGGVLHYECGLHIDRTVSDGQTFVYLDDALFTGNRIIRDLEGWMQKAPQKATVYICVIASHRYGQYWCQTRVPQIADEYGKEIDLRFWRFVLYENRLSYRNQSDVLWPVASTYNADGFAPRQPGSGRNRPFTNESNR